MIIKDRLERKFIILYIKTSDEIRDKRAKSRSGYNEEIYKARVEAENEQFENFEANIDINLVRFPTYVITNDSDDINEAMKQVDRVLLKTYKKDVMYLVVGRTCSGKDTICNKLVERNKHE